MTARREARTITELNRETIMADLDRIDVELAMAGTHGDICIAGSSALMLACDMPNRLTRDVDVLSCSPEVLKAMSSCEGDFNNAVGVYETDARYFYTEGLDTGTDRLAVSVVSPVSMVVMKLRSWREQDRSDIAAVTDQIDCQKVTNVINNFDFEAEVGTEEAKRARTHWSSLVPAGQRKPTIGYFDDFDPKEADAHDMDRMPPDTSGLRHTPRRDRQMGPTI